VALTKVAPALFGTGNNITSVTVGGSANTISLTFDGSGVITSATNNAVSVANTAITGNIISSQITSVANTQITGNITAAQITSVANTQLTGLIQAAQIGSANATLITSGTLPTARLPAGTVLQVQTTTLQGVVSTNNNGSPDDITKGVQIFSISFTPLLASSYIYVSTSSIAVGESSNAGDKPWIALFNGSTFVSAVSGTLAANSFLGSVQGGYYVMCEYYAAGSTSTRNITIRAGMDGTGTYINGNSTYNYGTNTSQQVRMIVMEIAA